MYVCREVAEEQFWINASILVRDRGGATDKGELKFKSLTDVFLLNLSIDDYCLLCEHW